MFITVRVEPKSAKLLKKLYESIFNEADHAFLLESSAS